MDICLFSSEEVSSFPSYLHASRFFDQFDVSLTYCSNGISNSLNEGLSCVKCSWTLIVHSGDSLIDLDESSYSILSTVLSDPLQSNVLQIFGSLYDNGFGKMSITNHQRKRNFFESMIPWIPHESTFVPSVYYLTRQYDSSFKSAMDFNFFHSLFVKKVAFKTYPFPITMFRLGGTSSDVLLSSLEYRRSIAQNNTFRYSLLTYILSWLYFVYIYLAKRYFLFKQSL